MVLVSFLAPWFHPYDPTKAPSWVPGLHLAIVLFLWNFSMVFTGVAINAIFAEVSVDQIFRARFFKYQLISGLIGTAVVFPVDKFSRSLRNYQAFQISNVVLGIIQTHFLKRSHVCNSSFRGLYRVCI